MEPPITPEEIEAYNEEQEQDAIDAEQDKALFNAEMQDAYGSPEADEKHNAHTFLDKAAFQSTDTIRTTFLTQDELGRPLFSMRFILDMEDVAKHYLDDLAKKAKIDNRIAAYFKNKAFNMADSGMSREGFSMSLNVMKKIDTTRRRDVNNIQNLQGGNRKKKI